MKAEATSARLSRVDGGLLALVALAPLPLASNRPLPAALLALGAGLLLIGWSVAIWRGAAIAVKPSKIAAPLALYLGTCVWIGLQWMPGPWTDPIWGVASSALGTPLPGRLSVNPEATLTGLMHLLSYGAVFWLSLQLGAKAERAYFSLAVVTAVGTIYALYGLVVWMAGNEWILLYRKWAYQDALSSTFVNRNSFATFTGLCLLAGFSLFLKRIEPALSAKRTWRQKTVLVFEGMTSGAGAWLAGAVLVLTLALLLTGSRGGFLSSLAGLFVLALAHMRGKVSRRAALPTLALGTAFFAIIFGAGGGMVVDRYHAKGAELGDREDIYRLTLDAIESAPWTGSGFGTFGDVIPAYQPKTEGIEPVWDKAHNTYLENALELGIPAAVALNLSILLLAGLALRGLRMRKRDWTIPGIGVAATMLVGLHALVDFSLQIPAVAVLYAFMLGIAVAQSWSTRLAEKNGGA
ncbi:O-antigen ligase family protein [Parvibaculum sp.]|uniref:O-antigen ligase family protein n=1 Tax=Parvibaculum sp. TaxID=2024848 RepID=UPI00320DB711